jgi:hypothetical protein
MRSSPGSLRQEREKCNTIKQRYYATSWKELQLFFKKGGILSFIRGRPESISSSFAKAGATKPDPFKW